LRASGQRLAQLCQGFHLDLYKTCLRRRL